MATKTAVHPYPDQNHARPRDAIANAQILGISELSEFLGFAKATTHMWTSRKTLPAPDYEQINGSRAWRRLTIVKWAAETGRLPKWLNAEGARFIPADGPQLRRRRKRSAS